MNTNNIASPRVPIREQHLNVWRDGQWAAIDPSALSISSGLSSSQEVDVTLSSHPVLRILTWNVEAGSPFWNERVQALLDHVATSLERESEQPIDIFCIQELSTIAFPTLLSHDWVRDNFYITDVSSSKWRMALGRGQSEFAFGSITLVRKNGQGLSSVAYIPRQVYRIDYISHMRRDALVVDLVFPSTTPPLENPTEDNSSEEGKLISVRVINVHLESLPHSPPLRPGQLSICAQHIKETTAGFVAGDFNAIEPKDENLAESCGLSDAWKQSYRREAASTFVDSDTHTLVENLEGRGVRERMARGGETWGIQAKENFPPGRLDRITTHGIESLSVKVTPCGQTQQLGNEWYWSDHCGLLADVRVTGS